MIAAGDPDLWPPGVTSKCRAPLTVSHEIGLTESYPLRVELDVAALTAACPCPVLDDDVSVWRRQGDTWTQWPSRLAAGTSWAAQNAALMVRSTDLVEATGADDTLVLFFGGPDGVITNDGVPTSRVTEQTQDLSAVPFDETLNYDPLSTITFEAGSATDQFLAFITWEQSNAGSDHMGSTQLRINGALLAGAGEMSWQLESGRRLMGRLTMLSGASTYLVRLEGKAHLTGGLAHVERFKLTTLWVPGGSLTHQLVPPANTATTTTADSITVVDAPLPRLWLASASHAALNQNGTSELEFSLVAPDGGTLFARGATEAVLTRPSIATTLHVWPVPATGIARLDVDLVGTGDGASVAGGEHMLLDTSFAEAFQFECPTAQGPIDTGVPYRVELALQSFPAPRDMAFFAISTAHRSQVDASGTSRPTVRVGVELPSGTRHMESDVAHVFVPAIHVHDHPGVFAERTVGGGTAFIEADWSLSNQDTLFFLGNCLMQLVYPEPQVAVGSVQTR